jgi:putative serine/threonine protein kinase
LLGITHVLLAGKTKIGKISIAGKGCVSIVLKVKSRNKICALKIRRTDANRDTMRREAYFHEIANSVGVGPKLYSFSKNIMMMEFADGHSIIDWIKRQDITVAEVREVVISILKQCYKLDMAHLDHGELSCLDHHVVISNSNTVKIIDFESSSTQRKLCNVTAAAQSLFLSGFISSRIGGLIHLLEREKIIQLLKIYKRDQSKNNFDNVLGIVY